MKLAIGILSGMVAAFASSAAAAQTAPSFYIGTAYSTSLTTGRSGGFNTAGPHQNTDCTGPAAAFPGFPPNCTNNDRGSGWSVFAGAVGGGGFRFEAEYTRYPESRFVTQSFPPPPVAYWYRTTVNVRAAFANVYVDLPVNDRLSLFVGGGVGAAFVTVSTTDNLVGGNSRHTNLALNIGAGAMIEIAPRVAIMGQVRLVSFGSTNTPLSGVFPAGNYTLDLSALEFRVGLVIGLP